MERDELKYLLLNFDKDMKNIENKIDLILEKYYQRRVFFNPILPTKQRLAQLIIEEKYPTAKEWDKIAFEEGYLSHITIEYIEMCDWRDLEIKIRKEIKTLLKK